MPQPLTPPRPALSRRVFASAGAVPPSAPNGPWQVALMLALTGTGALAGDAFRNGVEMAVQGINGSGGLLGRLIQISTFDTQSSPRGGRASLQRVLEGPLLALLGPVAPAETSALAPLIHERRVLQIAAAAGPIPADATLLFTGPGGPTRMAMLANWLATEPRVERLALLATPRHSQTASWLATACRPQKLNVVADLTLPHAPPGPAAAARDIAAELDRLIARIQAAQAQALFIGADGVLAARIIRAARQQAPGLMLFGTAGLLAPAVLEASGDAAVGVRGFASLAPAAPVGPLEDFRGSYASQYHAEPDTLAMQGYMALSMLQAAVLMVAPATLSGLSPSGPALAAALRAAPVRATAVPGILLDTRWDAAGEPHRVGFVAEVLPGGGFGWSVVPPLQG